MNGKLKGENLEREWEEREKEYESFRNMEAVKRLLGESDQIGLYPQRTLPVSSNMIFTETVNKCLFRYVDIKSILTESLID